MNLIASRLKRLLSRSLGIAGLRLVRVGGHDDGFPVELTSQDQAIVEFITRNELTMVSRERLYTTLMACRHVAGEGVEGDFVECGVWRGGNSIIAADVFRRMAPHKTVYLFDTFAGMTTPSELDVSQSGVPAAEKFFKGQRAGFNEWCYASLEEVKSNFSKAGLDPQNIRFLPGDVLDTLQADSNLPEKISVLRLDTDWYESTKFELETLYPRLVEGGVLIVDDYGHWGGAKKAVDEYFETHPRPFLQYTDYTGRVGIKVSRSIAACRRG